MLCFILGSQLYESISFQLEFYKFWFSITILKLSETCLLEYLPGSFLWISLKMTLFFRNVVKDLVRFHMHTQKWCNCNCKGKFGYFCNTHFKIMTNNTIPGHMRFVGIADEFWITYFNETLFFILQCFPCSIIYQVNLKKLTFLFLLNLDSDLGKFVKNVRRLKTFLQIAP